MWSSCSMVATERMLAQPPSVHVWLNRLSTMTAPASRKCPSRVACTAPIALLQLLNEGKQVTKEPCRRKPDLVAVHHLPTCSTAAKAVTPHAHHTDFNLHRKAAQAPGLSSLSRGCLSAIISTLLLLQGLKRFQTVSASRREGALLGPAVYPIAQSCSRRPSRC